jgi:parallel beta-helix repeat protein
MRTQDRKFHRLNCRPAGWIIAALLLFLAAAAGRASQYYVSPEGNDSWSGLRAEPNERRTDGPFATLQRARDAVRKSTREGTSPGKPVTVMLRGGVYYLTEPLRLNGADSGTEESPITYAAYGDEKPVISGGRPIRGWKAIEVDGKAMWAADLPEVRERKWFFHQLWTDGQRLPRARYPKQGYVRVAAVPDAADQWQEGGNQLRFHEGDLGAWAAGHDTEVVVMSRWVESRLPVERVDENARVAHFSKRSVFRLDPGDLYYVEHSRNLLEAPGEWYLDRNEGRLYLAPLPGATPETFVAVAPVLQDVLRIEGDPARGWVEHVTFRGLTFAHTEWYFPPGSNMVGLRPEKTTDEPYLRADVGGCPQAAARVPAAVTLLGARHVVFKRCAFTQLGGYGIALERACQQNRIIRCELSDLGAGGIKIGETLLRDRQEEQSFGNEVTDCHIEDGGRVFHSAVGIWIGQSYSNRLAHNLIKNFYYSGISIGWTWGYGKTLAAGNVVERNHVHQIGKLSDGDGPILSDMGGVYTVGIQPGTVIRHNYFHDIAARRYGGWGIYLDEGSSRILVENNVVTRTTHGGFHQHFGRENTVRNNIFAFGRDHQIQRTRPAPELSFTFERNIVYWSEGSLMSAAWGKPRVAFDRNIYWNVKGGDVKFGDDLPFKQWQAEGMDPHSRIADPLFVTAEKDDFRLRPESPALALGFQSIELETIGPRLPNTSGGSPGQPAE